MNTGNQNDERSLSIQGDVDKSVVVSGNENTVSYTTNVFGTFKTQHTLFQLSRSLSQKELRWRTTLLSKVKRDWIKGVLERSLHGQALIDLQLSERSQSVVSPISDVTEFAADVERPFSAGTQIVDIFDELGAGRTLLILGEPGAGKTTILLKIVETIVARVEEDLSQPIPVVLNLSSWSKKRASFAKWLAEELYRIFQVSKSLGKIWIREEQLILCLDGLDEVDSQYRNACVQAINEFLQEHGQTEIIICSRNLDYEALSERLLVRSSIYVQPLTSIQIDRYIEQAGEQLSTLGFMLSRSPELKAFAASPLILSIMSLTYQDCSIDNFPNTSDIGGFKSKLFDNYIEKMFRHRGTTSLYDVKQTKRWLIWIARQLVKSSQTVFLIEGIQPSWLRDKAQRLRYRLESSFTYGSFAGLVSGVVFLSDIGSSFSTESPISSAYIALAYAPTHGLTAFIVAMTLKEITPVETLSWSWTEAKSSLSVAIKYSLIVMLGLALIAGLVVVAGAVLIALIHSQSGSLKEWLGLVVGSLLLGAIPAIILLLLIGLPIVSIYGLIAGLRGPTIVAKKNSNEGIWQSAGNAGRAALIVTVIAALASELLSLMMLGVPNGIVHSLGSGLGAGFVAGLLCGGSACIRHFSLRLMLYRTGCTPWNYARFLEHITEKLFLQKVGGGYIFVHRMLQDHFAHMEENDYQSRT